MVAVLSHLSAADMLIGGFVVVVVVGTLGAIANAVLGDSGFGTAVNGVLLLVGTVAGAALRSMTLGFQ